MELLHFIIICLAAWNISSLLVQESGPFRIFERVRFWMGVDTDPNGALYERYGNNALQSQVSQLFMCVWCMSRWVAALLIIFYLVTPMVTVVICAVFAVSTSVIALDVWNTR